MTAQVSKFFFGLMAMLTVAGGVFLAFVYGGGLLPMPKGEDKAARPTFAPFDRGGDTGRVYPTTEPAPLNMATAEAWSLSQYATAVAGERYPSPSPAITWADELPDCSTGKTPCVFKYSSGPPAPAPSLATGGVNEGTDGHPQKDTDQAATFEGDKP
jgi:hypothetical protein